MTAVLDYIDNKCLNNRVYSRTGAEEQFVIKQETSFLFIFNLTRLGSLNQ